METTTNPSKPKTVHYQEIKKKVEELGPTAMIHYNHDLHNLGAFQKFCMHQLHRWEFPVTDIYVYDKATHQTHSFE